MTVGDSMEASAIRPLNYVMLRADGISINPCHPDDIGCYSDPKVLKRVSYQAIADAFVQKLLGVIWWDFGGLLDVTSIVMNTALLETSEIASVQAA
jgi:hypothetical protein